MTLFTKPIIGTMLLFIGVAGVFLPLMPGVIFIIRGSALLGSNNRLIVNVKSMMRERLSRGKSEPPQEAKLQKTMSDQISKVGGTS